MATKSRHLKTPLQLWIADNRKRLGLTPLDLARMTDVSEATVRAWESRGRPSEDALAILERRFGQPRPDGPEQPAGQELVAAAIDRQTTAIEANTQMLERLLRAVMPNAPDPGDAEHLRTDLERRVVGSPDAIRPADRRRPQEAITSPSLGLR